MLFVSNIPMSVLLRTANCRTPYNRCFSKFFKVGEWDGVETEQILELHQTSDEETEGYLRSATQQLFGKCRLLIANFVSNFCCRRSKFGNNIHLITKASRRRKFFNAVP